MKFREIERIRIEQLKSKGRTERVFCHLIIFYIITKKTKLFVSESIFCFNRLNGFMVKWGKVNVIAVRDQLKTVLVEKWDQEAIMFGFGNRKSMEKGS